MPAPGAVPALPSSRTASQHPHADAGRERDSRPQRHHERESVVGFIGRPTQRRPLPAVHRANIATLLDKQACSLCQERRPRLKTIEQRRAAPMGRKPATAELQLPDVVDPVGGGIRAASPSNLEPASPREHHRAQQRCCDKQQQATGDATYNAAAGHGGSPQRILPEVASCYSGVSRTGSTPGTTPSVAMSAPHRGGRRW